MQSMLMSFKKTTVLLVVLLLITNCRPDVTPTGTPPPVSPTPVPLTATHWAVQELTADYPILKIEVAGSYQQIGYSLGRWYQAQGFTPRLLSADEQNLARDLVNFYGEVHPSLPAQLRGMYRAYGLNLNDLKKAIPVSDNEGIRVLLPGLVEPGSCSVVYSGPTMAADGHARLGRNYDWPGTPPDTFLVFTRPDTGYATAIVTAHTPGLAAADGVNSQGLALGFASVRDEGYELPPDPALISGLAYLLILQTCSNVEEAITWLQSVPVTFIKPKPDDPITHILLADRSGESAVVEFLPEGMVVSYSEDSYQVMTNSHWAGPADQPECPRYQTAVAGLEAERGTIDREGLMGVMFSIHSSTQWTTLYDLENLSITLILPSVAPSTTYEFSLADYGVEIPTRDDN